MRCCINCFNSKEPKEFIEKHNEIDNCDFCGSENVLSVEASELKVLFEPLLEYYEISMYGEHYLDSDSDPFDRGESLGFLLQQDWEMFSNELDGTDGCNKLIGEIFDNEIDVYDIWCTVDDSFFNDVDADKIAWDQFILYIKNKRRFLLDFKEAGIEELIEHLSIVLEDIEIDIPKGTTIFRSRIGGIQIEGEILPFPNDGMGAPPPSPNRQGRGNPPGISYLYTASSPKTAVAEKRPSRSAILSLADMKTIKDLRMVDLVSSFYLESPFGIEFLAFELSSRRLLRILSSELSRPVSVDDGPIEYLPSQFLCELILNSGYDGVIYPSGFGDDKNFLIFDIKAAVVNNVQLAEVRETKIEIDLGTAYDIFEDRLKRH